MPFAYSLTQREDWGMSTILEHNAVMKMAWLLYLETPGTNKVDGMHFSGESNCALCVDT